jgi:hypothetical protein
VARSISLFSQSNTNPLAQARSHGGARAWLRFKSKSEIVRVCASEASAGADKKDPNPGPDKPPTPPLSQKSLQLERTHWGSDIEKPLQPELKKHPLRKNKRMEIKKREEKMSKLEQEICRKERQPPQPKRKERLSAFRNAGMDPVLRARQTPS